MKRYMILAMVAVMMLTSACKTSEGTMDRKPIDVGVAIAQRAHNRLYLDTEPLPATHTWQPRIAILTTTS